jgi:ketosteroid isomerase-like protein
VIVERMHDTQPVEVLDRVLDKGIVIDAWLRVSLAGIDLLRVDARVVVASIETYLKYADTAGAAGGDQAPVAPAPAGVSTRRASQVPAAARIAQAAIDAWNGHDLHGYGALLNDDYVGETHALPVTLYGRGAARRAMRMKLALFPDLRFDLHDVVTTGDEALVSWVATATCGHERVRVSGCTVGRVRNGKIGHTWCYWDASPMLAPLRAASDGPHTLHCFTTTS